MDEHESRKFLLCFAAAQQALEDAVQRNDWSTEAKLSHAAQEPEEMFALLTQAQRDAVTEVRMQISGRGDQRNWPRIAISDSACSRSPYTMVSPTTGTQGPLI